ncbi:DUF4214 domain-containing protein [Undibacterium sp. TS12]|uniref:DUF4214 domain-containing protein n=1 Tax=Undibacterium sp. TS12 TaxID=2908202 RepID=UPI001F4C856D|nr:DUF4214 domain-containing protein [Undibacterium sp. TS12]MCH8622391.1 DUF4214 domain-containing protein [Undibacterium sp. TS12]
MASVNEIQNLYIAYFNRPADVAGLTYWTTGPQANFTVAQLAQLFSQQIEYVDIYAGETAKQKVNALFKNLFNHDADADALAYWVGQINNGTFSLSQVGIGILAGATGADAASVAAKLAAANSFTGKMAASTSLQVAYSQTNGNAFALTKAWLAGVTDAASGVTAAGKLDATFTAMPDPKAAPIVVKPGVVNMGTAGNDTFSATDSALLASGTSIVGNGGTDVLNVASLSDTAHLATVTGVPTLNINDASFILNTTDPFMNQFSTINDYGFWRFDSLRLGNVAQTLNLYGNSGDIGVTLGAPNQVVKYMKLGTSRINIDSTIANLAGASFDLSNASGGGTLSIDDAGAVTLNAALLKNFYMLNLATGVNLTINPAVGIRIRTSTLGANTITETDGAGAVGIEMNGNGLLTVNTSATHDSDITVYPTASNALLALAGAGNVIVTASPTGNLTVTGNAALETIKLSATGGGVDNITVTGSTLGNIATRLVTVNNFKASGADVLHTGVNATSLGTINIATSDFNSLAANIASGAGTLSNNDYKAFVVNVAAGAAAGSYVIEHIAGTTVGAGDIIVKLTGTTGNIAVGDLLA